MMRRMALRGFKIVSAWAVLGAILACGATGAGRSDDDDDDDTVEENAVGLQLATGFVPDPRTETGVAGGPTDASTLSSTCRGFIPIEPQHTLNLTTSFSNLRLIVAGDGDTTMVIRKPDGTYQCDDDSGEGMSPLVEGPFSPGVYQVYIGMYASGVPGTTYTIGYSELSHVTATTLTQ